MDSSLEGGRVTRALRKRLTSVDSNQNNSRPGTPVQKMATLSETTESPRSVRKTRRQSISTPVATPVKTMRGSLARSETPEPITVTTPARRTRRRSLSITQDDEIDRSKSAIIKKKTFAVVNEEEDIENVENNAKSKLQNGKEDTNAEGKLKTRKSGRVSAMQKERSVTPIDLDNIVIKDERKSPELPLAKPNIDDTECNLVTPTILKEIGKEVNEYADTKKQRSKKLHIQSPEFQRVTRSNSKSPQMQSPKLLEQDVDDEMKESAEADDSKFNNQTSEKAINEGSDIFQTHDALLSPVEAMDISDDSVSNETQTKSKDIEHMQSLEISKRTPSKSNEENSYLKPLLENTGEKVDAEVITKSVKETSSEATKKSENILQNNQLSPSKVIFSLDSDDEIETVESKQSKQKLEGIETTRMKSPKILTEKIPNKSRNESYVNTTTNSKQANSSSAAINIDSDDDMLYSALQSAETNLTGNSKTETKEKGASDIETINLESDDDTNHIDIASPIIQEIKTEKSIELPKSGIIQPVVSIKRLSLESLEKYKEVKKSSNIEMIDKAVEDDADPNKMETTVKSSTEKDTSTVAKVIEVIKIPAVTPNTMKLIGVVDNPQTPEKQNKAADEKSKSVAFNDAEGENVRKTIYPKTPGHAKSKSYIQLESSHDEHKSDDDSFGSALESVTEGVSDRKSNQLKFEEKLKSAEEQSKTPYKPSAYIKSVQSSTPILKCDEPASSTPVIDELAEGKEAESAKPNESSIQFSFTKSWSKTVHSNAKTGDKIDTITAEEKVESVVPTDADVSPHKASTKLKFCQASPLRFSSDEEGEKDNNDDEKYEEEAENEKKLEKNEFVDDEAMEVVDYQSGDSMDSEERREIEENRLSDHGEDIFDDEEDSKKDDDEESEYEKDSFVCSDSDESGALKFSGGSEEEDEKQLIKSKEEKPVRKRIIEASSDSSDDSNDEVVPEQQEEKEENINDGNKEKVKYNGDDSANDSKLSENSLLLHQSVSGDEKIPSDEDTKQKLNASRKEILRSMNKSDRFNKTVHELDVDPNEESPDAAAAKKHGTQKAVEIAVDSENEGVEDVDRKLENLSQKDVEESASDGDNIGNSDSNDVVSLEPKTKIIKKASGLSVSLSEVKEKKSISGKVSHKSFSLNVTVASDNKIKKRGANTSKLVRSNTDSAAMSQKSPHTSYSIDDNLTQTEEESGEEGQNNQESHSEPEEEQNVEAVENGQKNDCYEYQHDDGDDDDNDDNDEEEEAAANKLDTEEKHQLEKLSHLQRLFNPLQKSKRQSLYMPSEQKTKSKEKVRRPRLSNCELNSNEFNPSQSFIETLAERQREQQRLKSKRKRLSKSFCGVYDSLDVTQELVRHPHKKSKLCEYEADAMQYSDEEVSLDNETSMKDEENPISTASKATVRDDDADTEDEMVAQLTSPLGDADVVEQNSKSPVNKPKSGKPPTKDGGINFSKIMSRCNEILEAANKAKLEQKICQRKNKLVAQKRQRLVKQPKVALDCVMPEVVPVATASTNIAHNPLKKQLKRLERKKTAVKQALKTAEKLLVGDEAKTKPMSITKGCAAKQQNKGVESKIAFASRKIKENFSSSSASSCNTSDQENQQQRRNRHSLHRIKTSTGYFLEGMLTPIKRKRYIEEIQTATGTVRVEPVSPVNMYFREDPITPLSTAASKMHQYHHNPAGQGTSTTPKSKARKAFSQAKKPPATSYEAAQNFKHHAMGRKNVAREPTREMLQHRQRQYRD